jgi:uncharacterized membrane protein
VVTFASSEHEILAIVRKRGTVDLDSLRKSVGFSDRTLRKALRKLESMGLVESRLIFRDLRRKSVSIRGGIR